MFVYNPEFFNTVSPKFLRRVNDILSNVYANNIKLSFICVRDLGAGKIPMRLYASEYCDELNELHTTLQSWSAFSDKKACVKVAREKDAEPVFIDID